MATKRALQLAIVLSVLTGCGGSSGDISRALQIVIPPEIPTIQTGTLYLSLWSYDGDIASASATLLAVAETPFTHVGGQVTAVIMSVRGKPQNGRKHYLTVEGCVAGTTGATSVFTAFVAAGQQNLAVVAPVTAPGACSAAAH